MNKYLHIIGNEIKETKQIHPFNDKTKYNLRNKMFFAKKFKEDYKLIKEFIDISNDKKNLFKFQMENEEYNIFLEHCDGGGRDISFGKSSKKIAIPYILNHLKNWLRTKIIFLLLIYILPWMIISQLIMINIYIYI